MTDETTSVRVFVLVRNKKSLLVSIGGCLNDAEWIARKLVTAMDPPSKPMGWTTLTMPSRYATKKFIMARAGDPR
jgi:hypothetical protein